jgi:hypothetical protein
MKKNSLQTAFCWFNAMEIEFSRKRNEETQGRKLKIVPGNFKIASKQ